MKKTSCHLLFALLALCAAAIRLSAADAERNFHIPSFYHVGFWVRDLDKCRTFYKDFLGYDEPYDLHHPDGTFQMAVMKVNERQVILLFPNPAKILPDGDNLDHLGLETDNVQAVHDYLVAHGVKVGKPARGHIGDMILNVSDPDGHKFEITQLEPEGQLMKHQGKNLAPTRISAHLLCASISVADLSTSMHFYCDILGFKEIEQDTIDGHPRSVHLQVPDGVEYIDLRPYEKKPGVDAARAVPQYYLEVPNLAEAAKTLTDRAKKLGMDAPTMSATGREVSVIDPDGTRVVLTEKN